MTQQRWTDDQWALADMLDRMMRRGPYRKAEWERQTFAELTEQANSLREAVA